MTDIMAALGLAQFERYPKILSCRQEIVVKYKLTIKAPIDKILSIGAFLVFYLVFLSIFTTFAPALAIRGTR